MSRFLLLGISIEEMAKGSGNEEKGWTFRGNNGFFRGIRAYFPEFIVTLPSVLNNSE